MAYGTSVRALSYCFLASRSLVCIAIHGILTLMTEFLAEFQDEVRKATPSIVDCMKDEVGIVRQAAIRMSFDLAERGAYCCFSHIQLFKGGV